MTVSVLEKIAASTRQRVAARKALRSVGEIRKQLDVNSRKPLDVVNSLTMGAGPRIIAEVKGKSPSKGIIKAEFNPVTLGVEYKKNGAAMISVLTEPDFFGGDIENLKALRAEVGSLPLLQKDFVVDEYQIYEAALYGADAVLLIVALLGEETTLRFYRIAAGLGLAALVEVHSEDEMKIALQIGAKLIGVNNRNLATLEISLETSQKLSRYISDSAVFVSESGIESRQQIDELSKLGYQAFLVGTSLMSTANPGHALAALTKPQVLEKL